MLADIDAGIALDARIWVPHDNTLVEREGLGWAGLHAGATRDT